MADDMGALTLLGESADWLKDAANASVRDHRIAVLEAYRAAWLKPTNKERHRILRETLERLLEALRHNHLYPDGVILGKATDGRIRFLPTTDTLRKDFEQLRDFCVINRFGIGEVHLLYIVLLLCRMLYRWETQPYDQMLADAVGEVVHLRVPIYRADNLAPFSTELQARYHAVRLLRSMKRLGLLDDSPGVRLSPQDQAEIAALLADKLRPAAADYIQRRHQLAYLILDTASALEAYARAHAANRAPLDERTPEEIFVGLRHGLRRLASRRSVGEARRGRMHSLGIAAVVRAIAHVDPLLGRKMYSFLRTAKCMARVRHERMFKRLPNNSERLAFLNFLYTNGSQNPVYYIQKFEDHFKGDTLRFVRKEVGFHLERAPESA